MRKRGAGQFCTAAREERLRWVLGSLTVLANDKADYSWLSRKTEASYTLEAISRQTQQTGQRADRFLALNAKRIVFGAARH
jgi:hypothetical protein